MANDAQFTGQTIGILGAGNVGLALAALCAHHGAKVIVGAVPEHQGFLHHISGGKLAAKGVIDGEYDVTATTDLVDLIKVVDRVFLTVPSTGYQNYVDFLKRHNGTYLSRIELIVICGQGFTANYADELNFKRIVETNESPAPTKWIKDERKIHIKTLKKLLQVSCHPVSRASGGSIMLPSTVDDFLTELLAVDGAFTELKPVPAIQMLLWSNYIVHAVTALCNLGRLSDPKDSLTQRATDYKAKLDAKPDKSTPWPFYFYGEGANTPVCLIQEAVDAERQTLARALGLRIPNLLEDNNRDYGTDYQTLREYNLAPTPHNVQHVCPDSPDHRYFTEEVRSMEQIIALAEKVDTPMPITFGIVSMIQAARRGGILKTEQYKKISALSRDELVKLGARLSI